MAAKTAQFASAALELPWRSRCAQLRGRARGQHSLAIAQPTPETHPHLMKQGEVTPGVTLLEYAQRRAALATSLPSGSVALFPSAPLAYMSHDVPYPYHQSPDVHYLCGFQEANCLLACAKPQASAGETAWHLFVQPSDPAQALWDGPRAGIAGASRHILPDGEVHPIGLAPRVLIGITEAVSASVALVPVSTDAPPSARLLFDAAVNPAITKSLGLLMEECVGLQLPVLPVAPYTQRLRLRKSAAEVALMRRAGDATAEAFIETMGASAAAAARGGELEALLAARFEYETKRRGAGRLAYPCVVASGERAVILHYMHNNAVLVPGDLLLMDAGASFGGYCADITRTWPLSGTFSPAQRDIYNAVLGVNEAVIAAVRADGSTSLQDLHLLSLRLTHEALVAIGVLRAGEAHRVPLYYPHAIGHYLGLDVHDTPLASQTQPLVPGMVLTVEPGLYFPLDDERLPR